MNEKNSIVKLATDMLHGKVETYDSKSSEDVLREALIAANGGSSKLNVKALRRNKVEIFEIIEELVPLMVNEGLKGDEFFMNYVEERNLAEGDKNEFVLPITALSSFPRLLTASLLLVVRELVRRPL